MSGKELSITVTQDQTADWTVFFYDKPKWKKLHAYYLGVQAKISNISKCKKMLVYFLYLDCLPLPFPVRAQFLIYYLASLFFIRYMERFYCMDDVAYKIRLLIVTDPVPVSCQTDINSRFIKLIYVWCLSRHVGFTNW